MMSKNRIKSKLMTTFVILLAILLPITAVLAATNQFKHYEDMDQSWSNGQIPANKSYYQEGEVIPHFVQFDGLTIGNPYYFYIFFDYYHASSNSCGYIHIDQYDWTSRLIPISTSGLTPSGYPPNQDAAIDEGFLFSYGVDTTQTQVSYGADSGTGDIQRNYLIEFVPTATVVDFWWGQHLALPGECNGHPKPGGGVIENGNGAGRWAGGGLRTKIENYDGATYAPPGATNAGTAGAISIMPAGIRPPTFEGYKWFDTDNSGTWDAGEYALSDWTIYLQVCTDNTDPTTCSDVDPAITDVTDSNGYFGIFTPVDSTGAIITGYYRVCEDMTSKLAVEDKWRNTYPLTTGYPVTTDYCHAIQEITDRFDNFPDQNFGNWLRETAVTMGAFMATPENRAILVSWNTVMELDTAGFNLYRSYSSNGRNKRLLGYFDAQNPGGLFGAQYEYLDQNARQGRTVYYWLEAIATDGETEMFGPVEATIQKSIKRQSPGVRPAQPRWIPRPRR
jgi:hypothetical protein